MDHEKLLACLCLSALRNRQGLDRSFWLQSCSDDAVFRCLPQQQGRRFLETVTEPHVRQNLARTIAQASFWQRLEQQQTQALRLGISALSWQDRDYPPLLRQISSYPLVLYRRGALPGTALVQDPLITLVGTRRPTAYGQMAARKLAYSLACAGVVLVSGLARGIDAQVHQSALAACGRTLAVLAHGLDLTYPPEHAGLVEQILESGLLLSEYPPGTVPRRNHFPARNRILSGLSQVTAVIEAAEKSGSLITAGFAADQGRDVFAVPGNIFAPGSAGCNRLIQDGAAILLSADDLLAALPHHPVQQAGLSETAVKQDRNKPEDPQYQSVIHALSGGSLGMDALSMAVQIPVVRLAVLLTKMELSGRVIYKNGQYTLTEPTIFCI